MGIQFKIPIGNFDISICKRESQAVVKYDTMYKQLTQKSNENSKTVGYFICSLCSSILCSSILSNIVIQISLRKLLEKETDRQRENYSPFTSIDNIH